MGGTAAIRSVGVALRLLNLDSAVDPVNFGSRAGECLLGQSRRADGEGRSTGQTISAIFMAVSRLLNAISRGLRISSDSQAREDRRFAWAARR